MCRDVMQMFRISNTKYEFDTGYCLMTASIRSICRWFLFQNFIFRRIRNPFECHSTMFGIKFNDFAINFTGLRSTMQKQGIWCSWFELVDFRLNMKYDSPLIMKWQLSKLYVLCNTLYQMNPNDSPNEEMRKEKRTSRKNSKLARREKKEAHIFDLCLESWLPKIIYA